MFMTISIKKIEQKLNQLSVNSKKCFDHVPMGARRGGEEYIGLRPTLLENEKKCVWGVLLLLFLCVGAFLLCF